MNNRPFISRVILPAGRVVFAFFSALFILKSKWFLVDYLLFVFFHLFLTSLLVFPVLLVIHAIISAARWVRHRLSRKKDTSAARGPSSTHTGAAALSLFVLYCISLYVAGLSLNTTLGVAAIIFAILARRIRNASSGRGANKWISSAAGFISCLLIMPLFVRIFTGVPMAGMSMLLMMIYIAAGFLRPRLAPAAAPFFDGSFFRRNSIPFALLGILTFGIHYYWVLNLGGINEQPETIRNNYLRAGSDMIFAPDGKHLIYLDKTRLSAMLVDRKTLEVKKTVPITGSPRDIEYDREKNLYYVVQHSTRDKQLDIINAESFESINKVSIPDGSCDQINAVAVDYKHDRILIGCDDSGNLYYVNRTTLEAADDPVKEPKPAGKGIVRILIDETKNHALTIGCLTGPYINEIDLGKWKVKRSSFTGFVAWEIARDDPGNRFFITVPLRSMAAIVDQDTLKVTGMIRAGFGARAIAIDGKRGRIFIGSQIANTVEVYDLKTLRRQRIFYLPLPRYFLYDDAEGALYAATSLGIYKIKI